MRFLMAKLALNKKDPATAWVMSLGRHGAKLQSAWAFSIYLAVSVLFFGLPLLGHFSHRFMGGRADSFIQMWSLAWWPYALAKGVNPIMTQVVWAPGGYNLAWTTSMPGPSLLLFPITRLFGPIVSYNLLCLLSPPLAALSMFVLCCYLTGEFWPAILGGYIFGFSQYVLAHMLGHVFLLLVFPVPLAINIVLLRLRRQIAWITFLTLLVVLLLFEFFSSTELFATTAVFAASALTLSWLIFRTAIGARIREVGLEIAGAYLVTAVLAAPYLYYVFVGGVPGPINPIGMYANDLLAFVVPTPPLYAGPAFADIVSHFKTSEVETAGYLGPGFWIILVLYIKSYWSTRTGKFLILSLILIGLMSLGPILHINGKEMGPAPWWLLSKLPLIDQALPNRFGMYFFLTAAVITSLYLSESSISRWSKLLLSTICLLSLAPNIALFRSRVTRINLPGFFRSSDYKRYLARNDNVLVLPYWWREDGLLWQAQTDFYFRLAAARLTLPPAEAPGWPVLTTLNDGDEIMDFADQFEAFLCAHRIKAVIVNPEARGPWQLLLSEAGMVPLKIRGVLFYPVRPRMVAQFCGATALEMAGREARLWFSALLSAASRYLAAGFPLAALNPWQAQRLNFLALPVDQRATVSADLHWWRNLWLGPWSRSNVAIGIVGNYDSLKPLVDAYGGDASEVFFPFPERLEQGRKAGDGQLLMTFTPEGLRRAANKQIETGVGPDQARRP
jgi:hypothetical protein